MIPFAIILVIFLVLSIFLITQTINDILSILVNLVVLWVVLLRSYFEIRYKKIFYTYFAAFIITTVLHIFLFDQIQIPIIFWPVWFVTILFILAQIFNLIPYSYRKFIERKAKRAIDETKTILRRL
jgi:hypothetical protein